MWWLERELKKMVANDPTFQDCKYIGKVMICKLDEQRRVKVVLVEGNSDNLYGISVEIIHINYGLVDRQEFLFREIFAAPSSYIFTDKKSDEPKPHWSGHKPTDDDYLKVSDCMCAYVRMFLQSGSM